ncbi:MAG: class II glutamine amidotransferase [Deltaproteobacteria bacterium]|nr:class II glutamine amidotransferase [Deltaproteobacteria bacterium]
MCRVFGFRSAFPSAMHNSLVRARNALTVQSRQHPDGWGIAFFDGSDSHLLRGTGAAFVDGDFRSAAGLVSSRTVLAHVRKASAGAVEERNCHPFLRGPWAFAHNGDIARWPELKAEVEARVAPPHRRFEGDTDSERVFALFLSLLDARTDGASATAPFDAVRACLLETVERLRALVDPGAPKASVLTLVVARDDLLAAVHAGNTLWYSTYKGRCPERDGCSMLDPSCEGEVDDGTPVRHLLIASEPLSTENVWLPVPDDQVVGVDAGMILHAPGAAGGLQARSAAGARI